MPKTSLSDLANLACCLDDYDPNAMSVAQSRKYIQEYLTPVVAKECLPLRSTLGRVLAEDIISPVNVPNHDNSAMDGYAFNADDLPAAGEAHLKIIGTAFAGNGFTGKVENGSCVRIMTGAVMPQGADTVVVQERVTVDGDCIRFNELPKRGMNKRLAGEDLKLGQVALARGQLVRPAELGLMASLGFAEIKVYRKLRVAFFSTGDELASVGQVLQTGQVYDSNRYTMYGMLARLGVEIIDMGTVPDNPTLLENTLLEAADNADVILTSGGVSVGEADFIKELLAKLGQVLFWKLSIKPGRPLAYGKIGNAHYFGLPGNPVAVMVTFYQFVREAILILMGQAAPAPLPLLKAQCTSHIRKLTGRTEFQRGKLFIDHDGEWKVTPTGAQGSGILRSMSEANCFIVLDDETGNLEAGALVQVQLLEGLI